MNISKTRTWLAVTALGALLPVEASMAADLPVKAQPIAAATFDWSGVYIGAHAGYGGGMKDWAFSQQADMPQADFIARGALAGGQIGINKQLGSFVFGMELAGSWAEIGGNSHVVTGAPPFSLTVDHASRIDGLATIAGRAGLAADRWFVFAKAGLSAVHEKHSVSAGVGASLTTSGNEVRYAPMLGFGSEYALTGNWSLFGEYGFHYLGERTVAMRETTGLFGAGLAFDHHIDQSIHIVKAGVNYRWGGVAVDPSYAALRPAPGNNWTGGYIGAQGGYAWGQTTWPDAYLDTSAAPEFRTDGWLAGGTIGVNAQAGSFVFGVEGEILGTGIKGSETVRDTLKGVGTVTTSYDSTIDWLALATARAGFVVGSNLMLYGKGGSPSRRRRIRSISPRAFQ
jgi:hypothetical protein